MIIIQIQSSHPVLAVQAVLYWIRMDGFDSEQACLRLIMIR